MDQGTTSYTRERVINLWARDGYISIPDGNSICIWGFVDDPEKSAQLPGPILVLRQGETVTVRLTNHLSEPVSICFPGQAVVKAIIDGGGRESLVQPQYQDGKLVSLTNFAAPGQSVSYRFVARRPGTYLYESGTNPHKQVHMGLYGAIVVRPKDYMTHHPGYKTAYGAGTGTEFDREYLLIPAEIDPELHQAVELGQPYDIRNYKPRYWTLNGRANPDTDLPHFAGQLPGQPYGAMVMAEPDEKILLRYIGAGIESHPLHPHGNHTRVVALDGRLLRNGEEDLSFKRFTVLVSPAQTVDQIFQWHGLGYTPARHIPTLLPGLRNLAIGHTGMTMWSGSPYLGVKGDLPVGIVSYNEMGEYHFMLHSHEEPQITNWGQFPGGLMTMIAIFPPGTLGQHHGTLPIIPMMP
ncbi:MAG: multicopper oxidase domain-containing protein [Desulfocucumaceae bacterium]